MSKTKAWIQAMRLRTLPLSFSVIIVGNAIAYSHSLFDDCSGTNTPFNWKLFGLTLLTTLLLQILSNFANDYGDSIKGADNDNRIGPTRAVQSGVLSSKEMLIGVLATSVLSFFAGIFLIYYAFGGFNMYFFSFLGLGVLSILGAIMYTVGKKAYGYLGLGDFFVFVFFGILGVHGSYYLHYQEIYIPAILFSVVIGCWCVAVLNLNNMRDRVNDEEVGKITLAVRLGFKRSKVYHYALFAISWTPLLLLLLSSITANWITALLFLPVLLMHITHIMKVYKAEEPKEYDPELKKVAISSFLFSLLFFLSIYLDSIY